MTTRARCACGSRSGRCVECRRRFDLGDHAKCDRAKCKEMNAPIACDACKLDVSEKLDGVITHDGRLVRWAGLA